MTQNEDPQFLDRIIFMDAFKRALWEISTDFNYQRKVKLYTEF